MSSQLITLPSKAKLISEKENTAVFEIENLYPGYGHTLGNSLRRIILSSLPGVAITKIKIDGAEHEFSTLEGVKEDVIAIVLHLKKLRFNMLTDEPQTVTLSAKGPKVVTSDDLELPGQVELLSKGEYIAEITSKTELKIEMQLEKGIGFVPKELLHKDRVDIGVIVPDASFAPIRRVNYEVENMRVADRTDYNKLRIYIETDGSISPQEALDKAITIMVEQLKAIASVEIASVEDVQKNEEPANTEASNTESLKILVSELGLSKRTEATLDEAGIRTVGGLIRKSESDILALQGLGQKGLQEIKDALKALGLTLKD